MSVRLNHTIVAARDAESSATFLAQMLGLELPVRLGHFAAVRVGDTSLDFSRTDGEVHPQHYAFLVSEREPYGSGGTAVSKPHPLIAPSIEPKE
jgi:catechol 2,3-dioxygenase-like lactoylglutathione lyase family enzyme